MNHWQRAKRNRESGQALAIVALSLVVLLTAAGFAIDMGYLRYEKRLAQMAADSAAIAGAACVGNPGCQSMTNEGQTNAAYNGFTDGALQTTVAINPTPLSGPHQGDPNYVEAIVTRNVPTFFMKVLGPSFSSFPVTARAVAFPGPGPSCIYALTGITEGGFEPLVEAPTCTVADGGDLSVSQGDTLQAQGIVYAGTYDNYGGYVSPTPVKGAPVGNPLAYLPTTPPAAPDPAPTSCGYTYCAGAYDTGLTINVPIGSTFNFQPGTYVIGGSGLTISGCITPTNCGTLTGAGVTFYINGGVVSINANTGYACDGMQPNSSTVQLSAPTDTTNPYAGILFIQNGNQPGNTITLNNGDRCDDTQGTAATASYLWGVLYFPNAQLTLTGTGLDPDHQCSYVPRYTIVVASILSFGSGDNNFGVSDCPAGSLTPYVFPSPAIPDPIKDAVLVE